MCIWRSRCINLQIANSTSQHRARRKDAVNTVTTACDGCKYYFNKSKNQMKSFRWFLDGSLIRFVKARINMALLLLHAQSKMNTQSRALNWFTDSFKIIYIVFLSSFHIWNRRPNTCCCYFILFFLVLLCFGGRIITANNKDEFSGYKHTSPVTPHLMFGSQ